MTADELLAQLRGSRTDLGRFVEVMLRHHLPHLVVPANAVRAWQEREPKTWAMVRDWLAEQGKSVRLVESRSLPLRPTRGHRPSLGSSLRMQRLAISIDTLALCISLSPRWVFKTTGSVPALIAF
jgi:hypothetical protein